MSHFSTGPAKNILPNIFFKKIKFQLAGPSAPTGRTVRRSRCLDIRNICTYVPMADGTYMQMFRMSEHLDQRTVRPMGADSPPANVQTGSSFRMSELTCRRFRCPNVLTGGRPLGADGLPPMGGSAGLLLGRNLVNDSLPWLVLKIYGASYYLIKI